MYVELTACFCVGGSVRELKLVCLTSIVADLATSRLTPGNWACTVNYASSLDWSILLYTLPRITPESPVNSLQVRNKNSCLGNAHYTLAPMRNTCSSETLIHAYRM